MVERICSSCLLEQSFFFAPTGAFFLLETKFSEKTLSTPPSPSLERSSHFRTLCFLSCVVSRFFSELRSLPRRKKSGLYLTRPPLPPPPIRPNRLLCFTVLNTRHVSFPLRWFHPPLTPAQTRTPPNLILLFPPPPLLFVGRINRFVVSAAFLVLGGLAPSPLRKFFFL